MSGPERPFRTAGDLLREQRAARTGIPLGAAPNVAAEEKATIAERLERAERFYSRVAAAWKTAMETTRSNFFRGQKLRRLVREALEDYDGTPRSKAGRDRKAASLPALPVGVAPLDAQEEP